jgi:beta-glucosidase
MATDQPEALVFPERFVWGTSTAAHQVEGQNVGSDFWALEHAEGTFFREPSGDACDQLHRYEEDIGRLAALGFQAYRLSVEWARVEPEEGEFSPAALDHYRRVLACCHEHGIQPCVTYHHFTSPAWAVADGGWEGTRILDRFDRYCERVTAALGDLMSWACTLNEPNIPASLVVSGVLPEPGDRPPLPFIAAAAKRCGRDPDTWKPFLMSDPFRTRDVMVEAHRRARDVIHAGRADLPVGVTVALQEPVATPGGEKAREEALARSVLPFLEAAMDDDFLGVQTYSRTRFGPEGALGPEDGVPVTVMGYEFWPEALEGAIRYAAETARVPIYVTENGLATEDDTERIEYVRRALQGVSRCLEDGIDVRGYFYWSMLDNFEWLHGYDPRFGLIAVDRKTQKRTPKPSAAWLGAIARNGALPEGGSS